ncbi:rRNA maturation RNase YbeY [Patescibacteria group bacterium]|nr:rRNA maturation RNase YbeY [Patescibacteria group bacterium]MBU4142436.1 rRNA maturation RNase YbeY [Patescibacteria group bacterium]
MEITNLTKTKIDTKFLQKVAPAASAVLKFKKEISLVFIGDAKMKELNKKYRGKNKTTDVLSFEELNEIFICLPQAKKQARELKVSINCELTRLLTHGIVHLKGYDHAKSAREATRMFRVEEKILRSLN